MDTVSPDYPKESLGQLFFVGFTTSTWELEARIIPYYNKPKSAIVDQTLKSNLVNEFFFFHNQKYIVYLFSSTYQGTFMKFFSLNGMLVDTISFKISTKAKPRDSNYYYYQPRISVRIPVSPSGRF